MILGLLLCVGPYIVLRKRCELCILLLLLMLQVYKYTVYDVNFILMAISLDSRTPFEGRTHSDYRVIL